MVNSKMIIGLSSGNFYRIFSQEKEDFLVEDISRIREKEYRAIEINVLSTDLLDFLLTREIEFSPFSYISLHCPEIFNNKEGEKTMEKISLFTEKYRIDNLVFHTDKLKELKILKKFSYLPISLENMDSEKKEGKTVQEFQKIFREYDFGLTLDLQHCYTNDRSMKNALEFQKLFGERITEYHLSGFDRNFNHYPLFKTEQNIIIRSLLKKDIPIIIESTFDDYNDDKKEVDYIKSLVVN